MGNMTCLHCGELMKDETACLEYSPDNDDWVDAVLAEYFQGYSMELWKCRECNQHHLLVANAVGTIYDAKF